MRGWMILALALALTAVPAAAQNGTDSDAGDSSMPSAAATMPSDVTVFQEGVFVRYREATSQAPETVTLRHDWQGMPVEVTYVIRSEDRWLAGGREIDWREIDEGIIVTVPSNARLVHVSLGGNVGFGTITALNADQNTLTVRLPNGESRTLRLSDNLLVARAGQIVVPSQLAVGQTVVFEVPPGGTSVALLREIGPGIRGTITEVDERSITVRFMRDGQEVTETFGIDQDTRFFQRGQMVAIEDIDQAFRENETVYVFGSPDNPRVVVANPTMGFETAIIELPEQPEIAVVPEEDLEVAVAGFRAMQPPLDQGQLVSFTPASADMPAMATVRFNWNGMPLLGTFIIDADDRWLAQGELMDVAQLQQGAMVSVPADARLVNLTFGGRTGIGTVSAIDRVNNTVVMRLPTGELRTLRVSSQALFVMEGQPMGLAQLSPGQTVLFEVVPGQNMVGLLLPMEPGIRGTVAQVTEDSVTITFTQNGQTMTRTFPLMEETRFYFQGMRVTADTLQTSFRPGQVVFIHGPVEQPQVIAAGVQTGFEAAVVTPTPSAAVAGVREEPAPPRRVIRGRW